MPEAVILVGIPACGKSTYAAGLATHVYINLDTLKTRSKEDQKLTTAVAAGKSFVVDNTNPTPEKRKKYIDLAKANGYKIRAVYFQIDVKTCLERNSKRNRIVPPMAIHMIKKKIIPPTPEEGFDEVETIQQ